MALAKEGAAVAVNYQSDRAGADRVVDKIKAAGGKAITVQGSVTSSQEIDRFFEKAHEAEARYIKIVFVAEDGVARARPVETGLSDERRIEIRSGLKPGDRVIVGPFRALDELKDGQPVKIVAADAVGKTT